MMDDVIASIPDHDDARHQAQEPVEPASNMIVANNENENENANENNNASTVYMISDRNNNNDDDGTRHPGQRRRLLLHHYRLWLYFFTALYVTFFAGAFFGWGPMQLLLENDDAFACPNNLNATNSTTTNDTTQTSCPQQTTSLLNVHFVASMSLIIAPLVGHLGDTKGPLSLMMVTTVFGITGILLSIISRVVEVDGLLYPAFTLIGAMGVCSSVLIVETGLAFPNSTSQQRVIGSLNNLFDAGSITYLILWEIQKATNAAPEWILTGYLGLALLSFGGALICWKQLQRLQQHTTTGNDDDYGEGEDCEVNEQEIDNNNNNNKNPKMEPHYSVVVVPLTQDNDMNNNTQKRSLIKVEASDLEEDTSPLPVDSPSIDKHQQQQQQPAADQTDKTTTTTTTDNYILISNRTPWQQLRSTQMMLLTAFFTFHVCRNMFTLTTVKDALEYLGDDDNTYLTIFTLIMPASILGFPFVDGALNKFGYHFGLQLVNLLGGIHGIIQVSATNNLNIQVVGFVAFSFYRSFLFFIVFAYLPLFLGRSVVGKAHGFMLVIAGFGSFVNIPLGNAATNAWGGNFFVPYLLYTVMIVPCGVATYFIGRGIQQEAEAKAGLMEMEAKESLALTQPANSSALMHP